MEPEEQRQLPLSQVRELKPGSMHYRAYIGSAGSYDATAAMQFNLMTALGLREKHTLLDIGCGGLSGGRLFIPYLLPDHYFAIEPNPWLVQDAIANETGNDQVLLKRPQFLHSSDFPLHAFGRKFDYVLAQSILSHTSRKQMEHCFRQVRDVLEPKGIFAANHAIGAAYEGGEWVYPNFATYPTAFLIDRAQEAGLKAFPLIWTNHYSLIWMTFVRDDYPGELSWLGANTVEQKGMRILELSSENAKLKRKLAEAEAKLKT